MGTSYPLVDEIGVPLPDPFPLLKQGYFLPHFWMKQVYPLNNPHSPLMQRG